MDQNFLQNMFGAIGSALPAQDSSESKPLFKPANSNRIEVTLNQDEYGDVEFLLTAIPSALLGQEFHVELNGVSVRFGTSKRTHFLCEKRRFYIDTSFKQVAGSMLRRDFLRSHLEIAELVKAINALLTVQESGNVRINNLTFISEASPFDNAEKIVFF